MAFLIDTGIKIVDKLVDSTVGLVIRQVRYIVKYEENLKELEDRVRDLDAAKQSVEERVGQEKKNIREADADVENWLTDVKEITSEASKILNREQKKVLCGLCPNLVLRHQQGRNSTKLVPDFDKLLLKRKDFSTYAHATTLQDPPNKDYEAFGSRTLVVNQIMDVFRNRPDVNRIGVYGLGGMGKTTLVKEISHQAREGKLFDDVAMILDVKQNPSIHRIQKEIAEKLKLDLAEDESVAGRARLLYNRIKDQKILIILDDVWEEIDLEAVGVSSVVTCKVLLTSRSLDVLSNKMHTQREFQLTPLTEEESWNLFEKMAGEVVKDPAIKTTATKLANKCGGLPVLVVTVASALKNRRTVHAWKDSLRRLEKFDKEELTEKTYLALEWTYGQLIGEELKLMFLLCGLLAYSSKSINILDVFKYSIGLSLFKNFSAMGESWDAFNLMLEKLKDSCLLLEQGNSKFLKMHDLVHDVAIRISSRDRHMLKVSNGNELTEWSDNKRTVIILRTSSFPKLPEVLQSKELELLHIDAGVEDYSLEIPCNFFKETAKLAVLDLSSMSILSLPSSLQFLKSLKTLCLDRCTLGDLAVIGQLQNLEILSFVKSKFKELPREIGQLTRLRSLDLTRCLQLELISPNVLSSLKNLEELRMWNSFIMWEAEGVNNSGTEKKNASLSELKQLSKLSCLQVHIKDANILPTNLFSNALERYHIYIGDEWGWYGADTNLNTLKIKLTNSNELYKSGVNILLNRTDELHLNGTDADNNIAYQLDGEEFQQLKYLHIKNAEFRHIIKRKGVFPNLKRLVVCNLDGSRFLLSSGMARSLVQLTNLEISECPTMEEIVSTEESDEKHMKNMFSKLEHLKLDGLPVLSRFSTRRNRLKSHDEIEEIDSKEDLGNAFFDKTVVFPNLKNLVIKRLTKLMTIWHNQLSPESFKNLETVNIWSCLSLKSVFPSSMVGSLQQLMHLEVGSCGVEEIIANEDGPQMQATHDEFVFSKVNSVKFDNLPNLRCFYLGMHVSKWPSLEELMVFECSKIAFLAKECSNCEATSHTPTNQALFLINKDSFPNLKRVFMINMEIWDGPFPVKFFSKLDTLQVSNQQAKSTSVLEKFLGLDEISFHEKGALHHLRTLMLSDMRELMHLGKDNSQLAGQNFPNLEVLGINNCDGLRNLRSSAISFTNLIALMATHCPGLEYLITYSTAKSLTQLKYLIVEGCARLIQIVGSAEDYHDPAGNEQIVFSRLTYLKLSNLPTLVGFCSGGCIVKFPALKTSSMSKRLKSKIFDNDETLELTEEKEDTDVDDDDDEKTSREIVATDTDADREQVHETRHITNENEDAKEHVWPLETTASNQGIIEPVEGNLAIIPKGEVTTPLFPVIEPPPVAEVPCTKEVGEREFSCQNLEPLAEKARHDAPEQPVEDQSDPLEPSSAATRTPIPIIHALPPPSSSPKPSGEKKSLRDKLEALSATTSSGLSEEAKAKLKALIATADLKDPHTRQHLLAMLPTLQVSDTKWIADLAVQELLKLPLVLDKEESLCQELAALKAQASKLDIRSQILLSEGSSAVESIQKVQEQKMKLLALEEQIKKLEAQATSLRAEIANCENKYSGIEASLDQLVEENKLNQVSMDSTSQELLRTRAVSDSLCTAIFTYLRQLF